MSEWTKFVTNYYHEEKKKNPDYMFKNALKDAGPLFKKSNGADNSSANKKNKTSSKKSKTPRKKNKASSKRKTQSKR